MSTRLRVLLVIALALLVPTVPFVLTGELPGDQWLSARDENALQFGVLGAGLLASDVILPIPSSIVGTLLGARLGIHAGFLWAFLGLSLGSIIGYSAGRLVLGRLNADMPTAPTLMVLFLSRPVPVLAEAMILAAGAGRTSIAPTAGVCVAGNVIYAVVLAGTGAAWLPRGLVGPGLAFPLALSATAWVLWRWRARGAANGKVPHSG